MKGGSSRGHLLLWEPGHEEFTLAFSNNLFKKESCLLNGKYETVLAWDGIDCWWNWLWISCIMRVQNRYQKAWYSNYISDYPHLNDISIRSPPLHENGLDE